METIKKRSESPSVKKGKVQEVSSFENVEEITEQVKTKKKNLRSKQKSQVNGKNNGDSLNTIKNNESNKKETNSKLTEKNGQDTSKKDVPTAANNVDSVKESMECKSNEKIDESVTKDVIIESATNSENHSVSKIETQDVGKIQKDGNDYCSSTTSTETENGANNNTSNGLNDSANAENTCVSKTSEPENAVTDSLNSSKNSDSCEVLVSPVNGESVPDLSSTKGSEQNAIDSDEDSFYEVVESSKDKQCIASSDFIKNDDKSVMSNTCSVMIDRKSSSPMNKEKQNSEISSSKKINDSPISNMDGKSYIHPYLGKISGRPGIKRGSNLLEVSTNGHDVLTPQNKESSLSDSFRVKSVPPRLNQVDTPDENLGLKKYKGKRCLNINDEFEYDDDTFASSIKRQKLDDKITKTGFLGSVLWSPFKKKPLHLDDETSRLSETQSKLSKFLSPFWFWKKTATTINERN